MLINANKNAKNAFQFIRNNEHHQGKKALIDPDLSEKIYSIISLSYAINSHIDFYIWLQTSVTKVLPHNMLLACWGNFDMKLGKHHFNYDASSNSTSINTQKLFDSSEDVDGFMLNLHEAWQNNNCRWLTVNNLNKIGKNDAIKSETPKLFSQFNSLLVYGLSDLRMSHDCLYIFFSKDNTFKVQNSLLGLLMPHIDNVLRKIQHIEPLDQYESEKIAAIKSYNLSTRELEIIEWVKLGKTDCEIAMILLISQNTVKSHLKHIFEKLNVTRRAQAVAKLSFGLSNHVAELV